MRVCPRSRSFENLESRHLLAADYSGLQINEIVAVNQSSLETRVREEVTDRFRGDVLTPDWIELRNESSAPIDLSNVSVTDDAKHFARWQFPQGTTIQADGFLVLFASEIDIRNTELDESGLLHADFKLDPNGDYFALLDEEGTVIDEVETYPRLDADLPFGRAEDGNYFLLMSPTPGQPNSERYAGRVENTAFDVLRGFYSEAFDVSVSTPTDGATIRYTTDGTEPTASNGEVYAGPISISTTTTLRSAAFKEGFVSTKVDTQSYVFVADVVKQPAEIEGFPFGGRVWAGQDTYVPQDTEMDPEIVNDPAYADIIDDSLLAIPTLSVTGDPGSIFGDTGWYDGEDIEGAVSVELLYPDDAKSNQQINAGIESHSHDRLKRSLRLNFREEYGDSVFETDYFQRSSVTGESATNRFNAIILRGGNNRSWARVWNPDKTAYAIDEFFRSSQVAMSGYGMRGQLAHLYINGVYWGLYNPVERADELFGAEYFGGDDQDWFTVNHGGDLAGNDDRYDQLVRLARNDMSVAENYEELKQYLDVEAFIDYLIIAWWTAVSDWPQNNFYGNNRNESANLDPEPFRFVAWDGEWSWGQGGQSSNNGRAHVHPDFRAAARGTSTIPRLWHAARVNPDFMTLFQDRVYHHLHGDGALTEQNALARWSALTEMVREAVVAESARWGDSLADAGLPTRTRDVDWQNEVNRIAGLIDGNNASFLNALQREGFYPEIEPPAILVDGTESDSKKVALGTSVVFAYEGDGEVYLGYDGVDPRMLDGSISLSAIKVAPGDSIQIDRTTSITLRTLDGDAWSAANRATFTTDVKTQLTITEFDFNPSDPNADEVAAGLTDNDMFEFVELTNESDQPIDLSGYEFDNGIKLNFDEVVMSPGETAVIARNGKAFRTRYGNDVRLLGEFAASSLSNGGETLSLIDPNGGVVFALTYDDQAPWSGGDGDGNSLHRIAGADATQATSWTAARPTPGQLQQQIQTDLNGDNQVDSHDIDFICKQIGTDNLLLDLNGDTRIDSNDVDMFVVDLLGTTPGDANLDGVFDSADLVLIFQAGEYEDEPVGNSGWADGDWNCDGEFTTSDLVFALEHGGYSEF